MSTLEVRAGRRVIAVSNADKVHFPAAGITEGEVAEYYVSVASRMVPLLRDRPLVMIRYPNGIDQRGFIQKQVPAHFPEWITTAELAKKNGSIDHVVCCDRAGATLAYLADQACLVFHTWLSRIDRPDNPDDLVFDLDPPDEGARGRALVRAGALALRELLERIGLTPFVKTSGSRGLHLHVPLDPSATFDESRSFARAVAEVVVDDDPERFTIAQRKERRGDRLFVDIMRNAYAQHAVAPYSLRARHDAPVALPLDWDEVLDPEFHPQRYSLRDVISSIDARPDPWAGMARHASSASRARDRLEKATR